MALCQTCGELKQMIRPLTLMLKHYGLEWKDKSLKVLRGGTHSHELRGDHFEVQCSAGEPPMSIAWCRDSEVLGSKIGDDGESLTKVHA